VVLNRRSTTWRGLSDADREGLDDSRATALMAQHPTLIKRPVIETGASTLIGFSKDTERALAGPGD
jgi:arsenate reductase